MPVGQDDFSIVKGGPTFKILRHARLCDDAMGLAHRRIVLAILLTWAPLLGLTLAAGDAVGPGRPFLGDIGFQVRFLVVIPILIMSEVLAHRRLQPIVEQFRVRGLIRPGEIPAFNRSLARARWWRDALAPEVVLALLVAILSVAFTRQRYETLDTGDSWYATGGHLKPAAYWLALVSLPLLQFLLLRWYFRLLIWTVFLIQVARLDLDLEVTHPDKAGGLAFLGDSLLAFMPLAFAHGALFAGMMADQILYAGATLTQFRLEVLGAGAILLVLFTAPLAVFVPKLMAVKYDGLRAYGVIGQEHSRQFRDKWLRGGAEPGEQLVGNPDVSSLADLGGSIATAMEMRLVPIRVGLLVYFTAAFLIPMLPLLLTIMSPDALLDRVVGMVF